MMIRLTQLQIEILRLLYPDAELPVYEIANRLRKSYHHIIKIIRILEELGLVEKHRDTRTKYVKLTEEGRKILKKYIS